MMALISRVMALLTGALLSVSLCASALDEEEDLALHLVTPNHSPGPEYTSDHRAFQGIPGLERAANGRLWATWYGGGPGEGPENYCMIVTSGDDGATWSNIQLVIDPPGNVRAFDPCLWHDPTGRLWFFWAQGYSYWDGRAGVWAMTTDESNEANPTWSEPRRLCDGIMMNKPTALSTGEWLLPVGIWPVDVNVMDEAYAHDISETTGSYVVCSTDEGNTWVIRGRSRVPDRQADEHMIIEKQDGTLWKLVRTYGGVGESFSTDRGVTWSEGGPSKTVVHIPRARFFIRRLQSGNLLLVRHNPPNMDQRSHLTSFVSEDDGAIWKGGLMLDERKHVSYPDGVQAPDETIYVIYDFQRKGAKQILMAVFTEEDVLAGEWTSDVARQRVLVNQATDKSE